jgi:hypothetical protein
VPTAGQSRDPALQAPSWMYPWEEQPEVPGGGLTLNEALEMPVLPGSGSASPTSTPSLDMSGDGLSPLSAPGSGVSLQNGSTMTARAPGWASSMSWSVPPFPRAVLGRNAEHLQVPVLVNDMWIWVDKGLEELVPALNSRNNILTITSCSGEPEEGATGYIMMPAESAIRFLKLWEQNANMIRAEAPRLTDFAIRDRDWVQEIHAEFPMPRLPQLDRDGHLFTCCWGFENSELRELVGPLVSVLKSEVLARGAFSKRRSARWSWAASCRSNGTGRRSRV